MVLQQQQQRRNDCSLTALADMQMHQHRQSSYEHCKRHKCRKKRSSFSDTNSNNNNNNNTNDDDDNADSLTGNCDCYNTSTSHSCCSCCRGCCCTTRTAEMLQNERRRIASDEITRKKVRIKKTTTTANLGKRLPPPPPPPQRSCRRPIGAANQCNRKIFNKLHKLLITIMALLITLLTSAGTTTTLISQSAGSGSSGVSSVLMSATMAVALSVGPSASAAFELEAAASSHTHNSAPLLAALFKSSASAETAQRLQQQRQLQQQQLFSLLNKNRQLADMHESETALPPPTSSLTTTTTTTTGGGGAGKGTNNEPAGINDLANTLETTGFVSDDGQQYEKAERILAQAADSNGKKNERASTNADDCPAACKCLNDFFDCSKQHLDRLPDMPNYVHNLDLSGNKLNDSTVLQLKNLSELHKLMLKRNQLDNVPKFVGLIALRHLNLANNRIHRISAEALAALPKLKSLDLSKNNLHVVEMSFFPKPNRIAHLILSNNKISNISDNAFESMSDLLDLELNNNSLASLPAGVFINLHKLKKLSLNYNHLEINWSTFKGLFNLQKLYLKSNNIRVLQDGLFHVMRGIETIELDYNGITSLSRQGLFNLTKLHTLSLSHNAISRIELDTWEFTQSLVKLDLSFNNITEFKPQHLNCLQRLTHLNLEHNKIQSLADTIFDCVKNLEELNLRRNRLAWTIEDPGAAPPFKALRKLKKLNLFGNNLKQINAKSLSGLSSLDTLNLAGNALASVQSGAFDHMPNLRKLNFESMNFICDCDLLWFRHWLLKTAHDQTKLRGNAVCGYPDHLLDRQLITLTPAELICADNPKPEITQEPSNQLTVKGTNITMECRASSPAAALMAATDELKIEWRHDSQNVREQRSAGAGGGLMEPTTINGISSLPSHQQHSHSHSHNHNHHANGHYSHSKTDMQIHHDQATNETTIIGHLRVYNVSYESGGKYQCAVSNAFGTTYSQKFKISIGIHPTFLQIPSNLTIDSGDTARLVCSATGDPMPEITLQKFGASNFPAATERRLQVFHEENAFVITNAKPIDTGIYTCTASSAAGEIKINASLIVNDKPRMPIPVMHKEIVVGESSVLECLHEDDDAGGSLLSDGDSGNPPHRTWFKDNKPFHTSLTSESERYYFTADRELLIIVKTQSMDAGQYRCEMRDNAKTHNIETELIVVKADFNENVVIVIVVLVTVACIVIGSLIVWIILCYQKRKFPNNNGHSPVPGGRVAVATAASHLMLNGSRGSALDQTQLTTLNRTYLQQQAGSQSHLRPRSFADLDGLKDDAESQEQSHGLLRSGTATTNTTPTITGAVLPRSVLDEVDNFTLEYMRRRNSSSAVAGDHSQDYLSSKDSGTGSDAAVKRSLDDFTITMMSDDGTRQHKPMGRPIEIDDYDGAAGSGGLAASIEYASPLGIADEQDVVEMCELNPSSAERVRFLRNNNNINNLDDDNDSSYAGDDEQPTRTCRSGNGSGSGTGNSAGHNDIRLYKCKLNMNAKHNTNGGGGGGGQFPVAAHVQSVDI